MKIVTWNVNGVRAALNKGVADWWNSRDIDVLCLQEIKAVPEQLTDAQHAQFEWPHAIPLTADTHIRNCRICRIAGRSVAVTAPI